MSGSVRFGPATIIVGAFTVAVAVAFTVETGTEAVALRVAGISALTIALFATRLLPETVTALLCFLAFLAIGAAPPEVIFSGFASGGFWLLFSGLVIGTAITVTGLGQQIALRIFRHTGASYRQAALLLTLAGLGLGLLVPSTVPRIIVLMPIALSLSETMGYRIGSRGHIGLTVAGALGTTLPTFAILTANLPTIIHFGAMETLYGTTPSYAQYFAAQAPFNLIKLIVLLVLLLPFAATRATETPTLEAPRPFDAAQRRLLVLLGIAIAFWATDSLHGISPAWVALTLAAVLLVPAFGMLDATAMKTRIDLSSAFFLAGIFAVSAVAQATGLSDAVADRLVPMLGLGEGGGLRDLYAISGASVLVSHLLTAPAAPAMLVPLADAMAVRTGWPLETVAMAQIVGISTPLLPYQSPPLIVAIALAQIPLGPLVRVCVIVAIVGAVVGVPLTWLWWNVLGIV